MLGLVVSVTAVTTASVPELPASSPGRLTTGGAVLVGSGGLTTPSSRYPPCTSRPDFAQADSSSRAVSQTAATPLASVARRAASAGSPSVSPRVATAVGSSSATVPSLKTTSAATIRSRTAPYSGNRLPDVLRPTMPPIVVTAAFEGSGPKQRSTAARWASSCRQVTPGCTQTVSSAVLMIRRRYREQSRMMPAPRASPASPVPAPRGCTGTPLRAAHSSVAATSSTDRGRTTPRGIS